MSDGTRQIETRRSHDLTHDAIDIFLAAVEAVRPERLIPRVARRDGSIVWFNQLEFDLEKYSRVFVVGGGKASAAMAAPVEAILGSHLTDGVVVAKYGHAVPLKKIRVHEAGHPVPDEDGVRATAELIGMVESAEQNDLVICLLSGGGSALLSSFEDAITLEDAQSLSRLLLSSGVPIQQINTIRKRISMIGGGKLARSAYPATVMTLVLSDVIGDPLESIASGPTVPDPSTFANVERILSEYSLDTKLPESIRNFLNRGIAGKIPETPKPGDVIFSRCQTVIIGNNRIGLEAAQNKAASIGYDARLISRDVQGESRVVAREIARHAKELHKEQTNREAPVCLLMGGETTVTVQGSGLGGRNQEFALSASLEIEKTDGIAVLSGGTDGTDGLTDAAGAIVDGSTCVRARAMNIVPEKYLENNDSYNFFRQVGGHLVTGATLTNVMDIMVVLIACLDTERV